MNIPIISDILAGFDKLFTSDAERLDAQNKLLEIFSKHDASAQELNKLDAVGNVLQRSWRPLLAYGCVIAFIYSGVVVPIFGLPVVELKVATEMLYYLLGYSGLRTFEKFSDKIKTK